MGQRPSRVAAQRRDRSGSARVRLSRPNGFGATKEEYVAWLVGEIEGVGEPVDLVGHDGGSLFVLRVFEEWSQDLDRVPPGGLLIAGANDPLVARIHAENVARRVGGRALVLEGCGHWWPLERPADVAAALQRLWEEGT